MSDETVADLHSPRQAFPDPIPGILHYGSVNLMSGASGSGKTTLKSQWFRHWLDGGEILGQRVPRLKELYYIACDRPWKPTYDYWFTKAGVRPDEFTWYALCDDRAYSPRQLMGRGREFAKWDFLRRIFDLLQPEPGSVAVVDPLSPLFIQGSPNDSNCVALTLHFLRELARDYQITICGDSNVTKLKAEEDFKRAQDRIAGSGAFQAYSDTCFNLLEVIENGKPLVALEWTPRTGTPGKCYLQRTESGLFIPYDGPLEQGTDADNDRPSRILKVLPVEDGAELHEWFDLAKAELEVDVPSYSLATFKRDINKLMGRKLVIRDAWGHYRRALLS